MAVSHGWQRPARGMGRGKGARGEPSERDRAKSRTQNAVGWERWWFLSALPLPLFNRCSSAAARTCCPFPYPSLRSFPLRLFPSLPSSLAAARQLRWWLWWCMSKRKREPGTRIPHDQHVASLTRTPTRCDLTCLARSAPTQQTRPTMLRTRDAKQ